MGVVDDEEQRKESQLTISTSMGSCSVLTGAGWLYSAMPSHPSK